MNKKVNAIAQFNHRHGGHCESGSVSSIVTNAGFQLSEPMAFGISSSIGFSYFPFIKVWGRPLISFRMMPRSIIKGVQKQMGIRFNMKTYDDQQEAMDELDALLADNKPVGVQTSISFLTYFLPDFRIPFNAHMTLVFGREGDEYLISDPVFDRPVRIKAEDLRKARFAKGVNAPRGFMFYPAHIPERVDYAIAIKKAVKKTLNIMLQPMFPFVGIKGLLTYARSVEKLKNHPDKKYIGGYLSQIVLFQEEVGTGGGGFRFMYAAFLREAYDLLKKPELLEAAKKMVETGDLLRKAAGACAKIIKGRHESYDLNLVVRLYRECAESEKEAYLMLKKIKWK